MSARHRKSLLAAVYGTGLLAGLLGLGDDVLLVIVLVVASVAIALGQKLTGPLLAAVVIMGALATVTTASVLTLDAAGGWYAKRCVRYVYWRNFHEQVTGSAPLPTIDSLSTPAAQRLLHGVVSVKTDPWFKPFHYLVVARTAEHPHKGNWDVEGIFWSNGPNGIDDGFDKKDDIDVTNSGL